jgi:hypothetical protein
MSRLNLKLPLFLLALTFTATIGTAAPPFDTAMPLSFFTNVAGRLLSSELHVNLSHLQIYPTNQYTPSVQRLLQVTANILDSENTNAYPSVFRPLFSADASNNVFIIGYQQVTNVSGPSDPLLAAPYDATSPRIFAGATNPLADRYGPVNFYSIPWVIGSKRNLPNFNQMSLLTTATVVRKLELTRTSLNPSSAIYATNQAYIVWVTNQLGVTFWNSYSNAITSAQFNGQQITVVISDGLNMCMTNQWHSFQDWPLHENYSPTNFSTNMVLNTWPGAGWGNIGASLATQTPQAESFVSFSWPLLYQSPLVYNDTSHDFGGGTFEPLSELDQLGLIITNYLQAYILIGNQVVDYVQLRSPIIIGGINQALVDPDYNTGGTTFYQWSTNAYNSNPEIPYGVVNQLHVSGHPSGAPVVGGVWSDAATPMGDISPAGEAAFFNGFFTRTFFYQGKTYANQELSIQAPFTPSRTVYSAYLLQINDPLVHYTVSDLGGQYGVPTTWANGPYQNGVWSHSDDPLAEPLPIPPISPIGGRYQPWGHLGQLAYSAGTDANPYNVAYKDPLVWNPDYWNFLTGQAWNLGWIGQVHRGTPWQTIYLKSTNVLAYTWNATNASPIVGINTWANWTGNLQADDNTGQYIDAAKSAPVTDWHLVSVLAAMLNTNDLRTLFSVNNPDPNAWTVELDGLTALTNTALTVFQSIPPQFSPIVISSNSAQASVIAAVIQSTKAGLPGQAFHDIGGILAAPQLTVQSPFLDLSPISQQEYGISDQAYEAIPSQLLPLLRADSIGRVSSVSGELHVEFNGYDGQAYAIQVSSDLVNWANINTNFPVDGVFQLDVPIMESVGPQFYRSLWLP